MVVVWVAIRAWVATRAPIVEARAFTFVAPPPDQLLMKAQRVLTFAPSSMRSPAKVWLDH
jgi:hypothetical protein